MSSQTRTRQSRRSAALRLAAGGVLLVLALVTGRSSALAAPEATCTWTGATSTAWAVAGNWDCGAVPGAGDTALIPNTTNKPVVTTSQSIGTLTVQSGGKVTVSASGVLTIATAATVESGGTLQLDTGTPVGTVYVNLGATLTVNGTLDLSGVMRGEGAVTLAATSTFNWRRGGFGATRLHPPD